MNILGKKKKLMLLKRMQTLSYSFFFLKEGIDCEYNALLSIQGTRPNLRNKIQYVHNSAEFNHPV